MGYGNLSSTSDSKERKHGRFQFFKKGSENEKPSTAPPSRHGSDVRQTPSKTDRVQAPAWNVSTVKAVTELDRNGYIKYNLSDKDDIYIRAESPESIFDDTEPVLRKAVPDKFAIVTESESVVKLNMASRGTAPVDIDLSEPDQMFINAGKKIVYDYDDVDMVIIKAPKDDGCDPDDDVGVEGDVNADLGVAGVMITRPAVEGAAFTEASAVEAPEMYRMTDCTDFSEIGDVNVPLDSSVISQDDCGEDMFEEVTSTESVVDFDDADEEMSPGELAIEAELDAEEAEGNLEADLVEDVCAFDVAEPEAMGVQTTIVAEEIEAVEEPAEPNFIDISMLESPVTEIVEAAAEPEFIEAPAEPNFIDISMLESPVTEIVEAVEEPAVIEEPAEPNFIDISMLESPVTEIVEAVEEPAVIEAAAEPEVVEEPAEPNFIDISMLESPVTEIVEAAAEPEFIEASEEPSTEERVMAIPIEFEGESEETDAIEAISIDFEEEPFCVYQTKRTNPEYEAEVESALIIQASAVEDLEEFEAIGDIGVIEAVEEPEVIEASVEPNFIDISMLESPVTEAVESPVIEVPSDSSSYVDMDEVGTESGIIITKIVSMEPAMTSVEATEPVASKTTFDYDDYDDFLPPTRAPERRDPKARFRIELMTAPETETVEIVGDSGPVFIADTSESSETSAPTVVDDEVSGVMKLIVPDLAGDMESMLFHEPEDIGAAELETTPAEPCPVHESTVSFTFSRGMESRPSRTGIRFLMGRL